MMSQISIDFLMQVYSDECISSPYCQEIAMCKSVL